MDQQFVYIDSSQEQDNSLRLKPVQSKAKLVHSPAQASKKTHWHCLAHDPQLGLLQQSSYDVLVKNLLEEKRSKQTVKQLITKIEDLPLADNISKRNKNYEYFIKKMEIDQKYEAEQQRKANAAKQANEAKKTVLYKYRSEQELKSQQLELKKFIVEKKEKQERVVKHLKGQIRKYGFERIYNAHKRMKQEIKAKRMEKQDELASRLNRQRDELLELQKELQQIKYAKRVNKLDQRKVIAALSEKVMSEKQGLQVKLTKKKAFEV